MIQAMSEIRIERMDLSGVRQAMEWAEAEGWEPGINDAEPFFAADPEGFFRAVTGNRTIATLSAVRGSPTVAFVGLYIVEPGFRGKGLGRQLWDQVLDRFGGVALGLDAVPEQVSTYASDGFEPAYGNARYSNDANLLPDPDPAIEVVSAAATDFDALVDFDSRHFFGPRAGFLREWLTGEGRNSVVVLEDGELAGFAASRSTTAGHRIGPVFTGWQDLAREMILTLSAGLRGPVAVDIPQPNDAARQLVDSLGMTRSFETTRMYRGPAPDLPLGDIFGITTLELG